MGCKGMDWIQMAQDRVQWEVTVNITISLWVS
jgi:hypothetical protein